jgi:hypothetical protein
MVSVGQRTLEVVVFRLVVRVRLHARAGGVDVAVCEEHQARRASSASGLVSAGILTDRPRCLLLDQVLMHVTRTDDPLSSEAYFDYSDSRCEVSVYCKVHVHHTNAVDWNV